MDSPIEVCRCPEVDQRQDGARPAIVCKSALRPQFADGKIFCNAPLHIVETGMIGI
jgi:hypothetical protein